MVFSHFSDAAHFEMANGLFYVADAPNDVRIDKFIFNYPHFAKFSFENAPFFVFKLIHVQARERKFLPAFRKVSLFMNEQIRARNKSREVCRNVGHSPTITARFGREMVDPSIWASSAVAW